MFNVFRSRSTSFKKSPRELRRFHSGTFLALTKPLSVAILLWENMLTHQAVHDLRPQTTAHLAQTMSFLQLSTTELEATLLKEINENPALELVEELRCPNCGRKLRQLPCPTCAAPKGDDLPVVCLSPRDTPNFASPDQTEDEPFEAQTPERLDEHILRQIGPALMREDRPLAAYVLARLDDDGLLPETAAEIALYNRVSLSRVEGVLTLIQHADPPGVGAHTPQASLLIQLEHLERVPLQTLALARLIISGHFAALAKHDYPTIARQLGVSRANLEAVAQFIQRNLTPYPARAFWGDGKAPPTNNAALRSADVNITMFRSSSQSTAGPLMVEVFTPLSGWLRVSPDFKAALSECPDAEREKWTTAVERAALVAKCVQQRNHTMRRLMEIIALEQHAYIVGGDGDLHSLTRAHIAKQLGLHESTISRAVAGKTVALPDGRIVPLAKFFDRSLSVRDRVRQLVEAENNPLTDDEIAIALARDGVQIARRTVAKYRNMLGILPANLRARACHHLSP
jgi:RNA polymerase sigma-54 factor